MKDLRCHENLRNRAHVEALHAWPGHPATNRALQFVSRIGRGHRTKWSAHVTADALDALGRTDEAKALRTREMK
jgi:hypothetical protein